MVKIIDKKAKESLAKKMTDLELENAANDCIESATCDVDVIYYLNEALIYRRELRRRGRV